MTPRGNSSAASETEKEPVSPRLFTAGCVVLFAAASAFVFRGAWNPLNTIEGADTALWIPAFVQKWTAGLFVPRWFPHILAGIPQQFQFLSHGLPLMLLLPPHRFHGFEYMLDTFLAGVFMFAFLRDQKLGRFGALVGGLAFQLGNGLLTSAGKGVLWRFETACWVPLFLLFFSRVLEDRPGRPKNALFAGATLGLQFLGGEIQLAYYVCLLAAAYFAYDSLAELLKKRGGRKRDISLKAVGRRFAWASVAAVVGVLFASEVFCSYLSFARRHENVGVRTEEDNWRFATEFSFAPRETLALAFTGRVLEGENQRHGDGQTARVSDDYIGIVVLLFAFLGLFSGQRRAYFFAAAAIAALIIALGRHFPPPYRLVYALPLMKGLRNPHKWLFITTLCVPILAGMGADYWKTAPSSRNRRLVGALAIFLFLMAGFASLSPLIAGKAAGGSNLAYIIRRPIPLLLAASAMCVAGRLTKMRASKIGLALSTALVLVLAGDLIANASRFIVYYDYREKYVEDEFVEWIASETGPFRVKLWSESPYLKNLATKILPYREIDVVDAIMSRRPARYTDIFQATREGKLPFEKLFQLFNVRYILSSAIVTTTGIPMNRVAVFNADSGATAPDKCHVYEFDGFLPRVYMVNRFETSEPGKIVNSIGNPALDLSETVVLEKQPELAMDTAAGAPRWSVNNFSQSPHRVSMEIKVDRPAILVLQDFMDENWRAYVDLRESEVLTANYLMRAVAIPEGTHKILFAYKPAKWGYALTLAGWCGLVIICLSECVRIVARRDKGMLQENDTHWQSYS